MIRVGVAYTIMHSQPGDGRERLEVAVEVDAAYSPDVLTDMTIRARTVLRDTVHDTWPDVPAPAPPDRK